MKRVWMSLIVLIETFLLSGCASHIVQGDAPEMPPLVVPSYENSVEEPGIVLPNYPAPSEVVPSYSHLAPRGSLNAQSAPYRLQVGDSIDITFFKTPELNTSTKVRPDGKISLQLIDEVHAAGLPPTELKRELLRRYETELRDPQISVNVRDFGGQRVYVGGEVERPGMLTLDGGVTALQAIQQAGGFLDTAALKSIVLIRRNASGIPSGIEVDLSSVVDGSDPGNDPLLQSFDVVFVPKTRIANLNVFVDQYLRRMIPVNPSFGVGLGVF